MNKSSKNPESILIILAEDIIVRNILDAGVFKALKSAFIGRSITCITPKGRSVELSTRFTDGNIVMKEFSRSAPKFLDALLATLLYAGLPTHTNHWSKMRAYLRGDATFLPTYLKRLHSMTLGRIHMYQRFLRWCYIKVGKDENAIHLFDEVQPSLVISFSVTNFDTDVVLMREARRRGIRIIGMSRSWDNLTSHGVLRVVPDRLIVGNSFLKDSARGVQGIREQDAPINVVGIPHYDAIQNIEAYVGDRETFCRDHGLNPTKKIILYGAMGTFLFPHENDLPLIFSKIMAENIFNNSVQVLYRPHPKFPISEDIQNLPGVVIDHSSTYRTKVTDNRSASEELFRSMYHSDIIVTAGSTFAIDAAVVDKPIICMNFDGSAKREDIHYWESVNRFYDSYTHFEELLAQGGVRVAETPTALITAIRTYLMDPSLEHEGRTRIVQRFVENETNSESTKYLASILVTEISHTRSAKV